MGVIGLGLMLGACGDSAASQDEIDRARREGVAKARQQQKIDEIEKQLKGLKRGRDGGGSPAPESGGSPPPSSGTFNEGSCGGSLSVGPITTCGFAANVEADYY